ncbi:MAG TPA: LysR family transcriptional regulator [Roseomonas sp.]
MNRLAAMEVFVRVVDAGSFSGAARQLRIGQPAVSKTVALLEQRLGVRLLLRSTHGLTPTEAGRIFRTHAERCIEAAETAELAARGAGATLSGRLRICAPVTFSRLHLMPRLPAFLAAHPALDIEVVLDDRDIDLIEAGIDVGLRMGRFTDAALTARRIGRGRRLVLGTPAYFAAAGVPRTPAELPAHQAVIHDQRGGGAAWIFRQGTAEIAVTLRSRVRVTAAEGVREGVLAGLGLAIASDWMFAPELASGAIRPVMADWSLPPVDLWAVFPTGRQASAKAQAFMRFIETHVSNQPVAHAPGG